MERKKGKQAESTGLSGKNQRLVKKRFSLKPYRYTKAVRLRKRAEFVYTSTNGRRVQNRNFIAYYISNQRTTSRLGITATKRVGKAFIRNRIKRIIREYFRIHRECFGICLDINVIAKKETAAMASKELICSLDHLFQKIKRDCGYS